MKKLVDLLCLSFLLFAVFVTFSPDTQAACGRGGRRHPVLRAVTFPARVVAKVVSAPFRGHHGNRY